MKTKTEKKVATPAIVSGAGYKELFRGDYKTSEISIASNFRKTFNEKALQELAENIGKVGVLQPVILRMDGKGKYPVLVAGERRYRAAMLAGLKTIPGRILDLTEEQALEVQALENLHRKDLSPIEEARAFKVLLDQKGHSVEQAEDLAGRVGKTSSYVYRALRLLELPDNAIDNIESGKWTPAHGHQLLRLENEVAVTAAVNWLDNGGDNYNDDTVPSALSLRHFIERGAKLLIKATFTTDQDYAGCQGCNTCPSNTSNQSGLFDGAENGQCLDPKCYDRKSAQVRKDTVAKALEAFPAGVKNLGTKMAGGSGNIQGLKGAVTLDEKSITKDVRKIMETNPKAFGVTIINSRYEYENRDRKPVVVCLDPTVLGSKAPATQQERQTNYEKENFIEKAVKMALMKAAWEKPVKKLEAKHLALFLDMAYNEQYNLQEEIDSLLGMKKSGDSEDHIKNAKDNAIGLVIIAAEMCIRDGSSAFKDLGVDVKGITKTAKAAAAKEYEAKKVAEKAAKTKPEKQDRDADSSGNDADGDE